MAERAGKMAERTNLRPVGVIENIELRLPPLRRGHRIFGEGGGSEAARTLGVPLLAGCRWSRSGGGDTGAPIVASDPDSVAGMAFREAARSLAQSVRSKVGKPLTLLAGPGAPADRRHAH